ncbi:MAG: Ig-like domain-containing protein [Ignavibacteriales bacterium]|nr:Ig-like domain-containing protein [Ignavibacteriales bacterium]
MNVRTILLWGIIAVLTLLLSCQNPTGPDTQITAIPTSVSGMVMRNDNLAPITNAIVYDIGGLARDTSRSNGTFRLVYQLLSQTKTRIIGSRSGFGNDTAAVTLNPGVDTTIVLTLKADSTSPTGPVSTGKAANIVLIASSGENISIRGTGSNETANLQFEVRDSLGVPIAGVNKLSINFSILGGPGGGEYVFPATADTDPLTGRVTTRVSSGTKAGVLQVVATATVAGTPPLTIKSSPIKITISGGLPDKSHFSISRKPLNIAGGVYDNLRAVIMVIVGDKEGNPVQPGTAVSFTTTGGVIQPNAVTDKDGIAQVELISSNPRPPNSIAFVTAKTIGDSGKVIKDSTVVLFSGATRILPPPSTVIIPDSGVASFEYRVQDPNGSPLAGGTTISLSVDGPGSGQLELSGDVNKTLEDSNDPASTLFKATVRDKALHGPAGAVTFKISVISQNGNLTTTFPGNVLIDTNVAIPPSKSGTISSLALVGIDNSQLSISGTGANETAKLTFIAKDSLGNPVELRKRAYVTFTLSPPGGLGGGEFLFPAADSTDAYGQISTTFNAGTRAGVLQVIARSVSFGRTITTSPIKITIAGGLPDSNHVTATLSQVNMPGLIKTGTLGTVSVQLGDKYGNAVQAGTALYFSTSGGLIQATATTDAGGQASATIQGGNPAPNEPSIGGPGHGFITVQSVGAGVSIQKKVPFLFSGATRVVTPSTNIVIPDSGSATFQYRVQDINGNPLVVGSTVALSVDGPGSGELELSGDVNKILLDSADPSTTLFTVTARDKAIRGPAGQITFHLSVTSPNGNAIASFSGLVLRDTTAVAPGGVTSGYASNLTLATITSPQVSVRGTGANETSVLTFIAKDSVGNPVEIRRRAYVTFSITPTGGVGGGEFLYPAADSTDASGQVSTTFSSGTRSGVLQLVAQTIVAGRTLTSSPIKLTISGGLPDSSSLSVSLTQVNMPGLIKAGALGSVTAQVGDKFGNPVQPGTALYFSISGGLIQPTATTDVAGQATATIQGGNPPPNEPTLGGPGHGYITVQTVGENGVSIKKRRAFLFSGETRIVTPSANIVVPDSGTATFQYRVQDINGNALVAGTSIVMTVDGPGSGQLELSGDANKILLDSADPSTTLFTVTVRDKILRGPAGAVTFHLSVTSPNGNAIANFGGIVSLDTSAVPPVTVLPPTTGYASSLLLFGPAPGNVSVRGTGASETSIIKFQALDSLGRPIEFRRRAYVTFLITPVGGTGGGEYLYPAADSTDGFGLVASTFNAGTRSGVIQIVAQAIVNGRTITSSPIKMTISSGLPNLAHFTSSVSPTNMPGSFAGPVGTVAVQVGDKFGNPVQAGTALYFTTSGGIIQPTGYTDIDGHASVTLFGGNPFPRDNNIPGLGHVTVRTVSDSGIYIETSLPFLFSGSPQLLLINVPNDTVKVFDGSYVDINYSIRDLNGNPVTAGRSVSVAVSGQGASGVTLSGDVSFVTDGSRTAYSFRVADRVPNGDPSGELVFTITAGGETTPVVQTFHGILYSPSVTTTVPPSARKPSQIAYIGLTTGDIYVAGVGNVENAVITYEVRDLLGVPIDKSQRVQAFFNLQFQPNSYTGGGTYPSVIPGSDSTDNNGRLRASIVSGTQAGVITIVVSFTVPGGQVVQSLPVKLTVHAGFADQAHFSLVPTRYVFPIANSIAIDPMFNVAVGDTFSNPVQAGTAVYFNSQAGIMQTGNTSGGTYTNYTGLASAGLLRVNPLPYGNYFNSQLYRYIPGPSDPYYTELGGPGLLRSGYAWVWATTQGKGGKRVADSVLVVWSQGPIVVTGIPSSVVTIPRGSTSAPITITVKDANGNPLCDGTTISASINFTSDVVGLKFGVSGSISDAVQFVMPAAPFARFSNQAGVTDFTFRVSDLSTNGGAPLNQTVIVNITISSPNFQSSTYSFTAVVQ